MYHKTLTILFVLTISVFGCDSKKEPGIDGSQWQTVSVILSKEERVYFENGTYHYWLKEQPSDCYEYTYYPYSETERLKGKICAPIKMPGDICLGSFEVSNDTLYVRFGEVVTAMRQVEFDNDQLLICGE
ncbi:hypothetical protein L6Q79_05440 [bacterium]|nr:hypothetical protein [bacterium]NUN44525.1 hypothetical protein [bacterium]